MYLDYYYLILIVPVLVISLLAQARVNSVHNVRIEHIRGKLNDHYDPKTNVIRLSDGVYGGCSIAAIGVACHEAGHAAQHAEGYAPIKVRNAFLLPAQIGSNAAIPLAIVGIFLGSQFLMNLGIFLYAAVMLFQLCTLPVEFNASHRAISVIQDTGLLAETELGGAQKVLRAAAMTYVAAFAMSAAQLLRLLLLTRNRRD